MLTRDAYLDTLSSHGRRAANRVAYASMGRGEGTATLGDFYAMYGGEEHLPEHERCRTGLIYQFDPTGWFALYRDRDAKRKLEVLCKGARTAERCQWFFSRDDMLPLIVFAIASKPDAEMFAAIERLESDDESKWIAEAMLSLTEDDLTAIRSIVDAFDHRKHRWPDPGTQEAEALLQNHKEVK